MRHLKERPKITEYLRIEHIIKLNEYPINADSYLIMIFCISWFIQIFSFEGLLKKDKMVWELGG